MSTTYLETFPWWIALPAAFFMVVGSTLALLGSLGLWQLKSFYDRLHAPTLVSSWGAAAILLASILLFSWGGSRLVIHELVIGIFLLITTPVTLMMVGRAALYRDRVAGSPELPEHLHLHEAAPPASDPAPAAPPERKAD
ncbi:monovalent cation/H(+) antiporter subunit G [Falsigemmobacter intermedius]|uniref:Cation:proton antiporter n=1 Tax=Falsigemmobacter intermedius TaxID=1553448 RepID=A0A444MCW7_9RHOB|nr:monovalent cation/H(+) antiporter subunit G [Falsigemmobacter intermedius]RWY42205.1 cation:proton antiporter [Falsigemmobacter intermedius]